MPRRELTNSLVNVVLDGQSDQPFYWQLFNQVRREILAGHLAPGTRLPPTRQLAAEFGCSRTTVLMAFEHLLAEGYLETRSGSGTFVADRIPDDFTSTKPAQRGEAGAEDAGWTYPFSQAGETLVDFGSRRRRTHLAPFEPGMPGAESFPFDVWCRLIRKAWARPTPELLRWVDAAGLPDLRAAIAAHLQAMRGLTCTADDVVVTSGTSHSFDFLSRLLADPGDEVWVEEPGVPDIYPLLRANGMVPVPVPVDEHGLVVEEGLRRAPRARIAIVTPSHQYPTGYVMSLERRVQLIEWARRNDAWILEDDFDMEFRYAGRMQSALRSLDRTGHVIYLGTFSKICFTNIRLGYVIADALPARRIADARQTLDFHSSYVAQPAMAAFLREGHFAAHVRRVRQICEQRQQVLLAAADEHLRGLLEFRPDGAGVHLFAPFTAELAAVTTDSAAAAVLAGAGVVARPLSSFYAGAQQRHGFVLNYGGISEAAIERYVATLGRVLREMLRGSTRTRSAQNV